MDEPKENIALRLWNGPITSDTVTRQNGDMPDGIVVLFVDVIERSEVF